MTVGRALAERIASLPFTSATEHRRFDVSATPANITLAVGAYEILNEGSNTAFVRLGTAVSIPSSGAAAVTGQVAIPAGGAVTLVVDDDHKTMHGLTSSGVTTLSLMRKPL